MENKLSYDHDIKRVEQIVHELEQTEALSVAAYKQKADEAKKLLLFCESELKEMEQALAEPSAVQ